MEPVRPRVDSFLFDWISGKALKREWFFEQGNGNCRLMASLATTLSETAPMWRRAVAPFAEWIAHTLWSATPSSERDGPPGHSFDRPPQTGSEWRSSDAASPARAEAGERLQNLRGIHPLRPEVLWLLRRNISERADPGGCQVRRHGSCA